MNNKEFYEYYRSKGSYKDDEYFVRKQYKNLWDNCSHINSDSKLCTSHDFIFSTFIANEMLEGYLENKLEELNGKCKFNSTQINHKFNWTGTKVDLTEIVYGFQTAGSINNGNFDLKEFAIFLGTMFNVEIVSNLYGNYSDIKSRKVPKTRFINTMSDKLIEKMDNEDSKKMPK